MTKTTALKIVSPEAAILETNVEMAIIPGVDGDLGILPDHSALVSSLRAGEIVLYNGGRVEQRLFVSGGFATINASSITILAEGAVNLASITKESILHSIEHDSKSLNDLSETDKIIAEQRIHDNRIMVQVLEKSCYN